MVMEASTIVFTQWLSLLSETSAGPTSHPVIERSCSFMMILEYIEQICSIRLKLAHWLISALPPYAAYGRCEMPLQGFDTGVLYVIKACWGPSL